MMSTKSTSEASPRTDQGGIATGPARRGFGIPTILAIVLPLVILVGALALSHQASFARRTTSSLWMSYVAFDLAEGAIAEASHFLRLEDVFDSATFGSIYGEASATGTSFPTLLLQKMAVDYKNPVTNDPFGVLPERDKEYRGIWRKDSTGTAVEEIYRMLTAFQFPERWDRVEVPGLAQQVARNTPGVLLEADADLSVYVRPLSFRREFYHNADGTPDSWVNWGIVQFRVKVRTREIRDVVTREIRADRRFCLRSPTPGDPDLFKISSVNLRTSMIRLEV